MRKILFGIIAVLALSACSGNVTYSGFRPMKSCEWHMDSVAHFEYSIPDASNSYQMLLYLRHTERYPYQNLWIFVENAGRKDTIEFYLADDRGQWLGDKHNGFIEMPVLLEENILFPDTGTYEISIQQAMRDTLLKGVSDVGIEIRTNK